MSQISSCARSQSLDCDVSPWPGKQLMHRFLLRSRSIFSILACVLAPGHSFGSPSDRVLVPLATPLTSTLNGATPPFLLHITTQSAVGCTFSICVFATGGCISVVPVLSKILFDA